MNAAPTPAPPKYSPLLTGITVHEQAATKKLAPAAVEELRVCAAAAPRRTMIASLDTNVTRAPASRNAGMRHVSACRATYSMTARIPPLITSASIMITDRHATSRAAAAPGQREGSVGSTGQPAREIQHGQHA